MQEASRKFEAVDAASVREPKPLLVGITSPSGGGKTFSALTLATGMQKVTGGEIYLVDTEAGRSLQYQGFFKFKYVKFAPPHSPAAYEKAIDFCVKGGAKIIIMDSMSHEHSGDGGVLDQVEEYLQKKGGDDYDKRERYKWAAQIEPKRQRKTLNTMIEQLGGKVIFIFCYRAEDKIKPAPKGATNKEPIRLGWTAETTSKLPYMMTVRFLLPPGSDGCPNLTPDTEFEKLSIKMPIQFRGWFTKGLQLNADLGERLAKWSIGISAATPEATSSPATPAMPDLDLSDFLDALATAPLAELAAMAARNKDKPWSPDQRAKIKAAIDARTKAASKTAAKPAPASSPAADFVMSTSKQRADIGHACADKGITQEEVCTQYEVAELTDLSSSLATEALSWVRGLPDAGV